MSRQKLIDEKRCRLCDRHHSLRTLTRHHLVPQRWFLHKPMEIYLLRNAYDNVVPLCRPCHDLVETESLVRSMLRRRLTVAEEKFCVKMKGRAWLNNHYPYWSGDHEPEVVRLIEDALYRERERKVQKNKQRPQGKMVHKHGCDPMNGCAAGCPVAVKYGTWYPSVRVGVYR